MTKEELLSRLNGVEWNDFEIKEAQNEIPKTAWETVSAFSNSYGGWIVFGVKERRAGGANRLMKYKALIMQKRWSRIL